MGAVRRSAVSDIDEALIDDMLAHEDMLSQEMEAEAAQFYLPSVELRAPQVGIVLPLAHNVNVSNTTGATAIGSGRAPVGNNGGKVPSGSDLSLSDSDDLSDSDLIAACKEVEKQQSSQEQATTSNAVVMAAPPGASTVQEMTGRAEAAIPSAECFKCGNVGHWRPLGI
jgi:hypothetical protein